MTISQSIAVCNSSSKSSRRLYDHLYKDLAYVSRANDPTKLISPKARIVLANLVMMISRNSESEEFIDHNFLSSLTHCNSTKQNANILSQLADIIEYEYHNHICFQSRKRSFGYTINFTTDGMERIKNPKLFYRVNPNIVVEKNFELDGNKLPSGSKKISTSYISNNNNLNNNSYSYSKFNCDEFEEKQEVAKKLPPVIPAANPYYDEKRSLSRFHPISEDDGQLLCKLSERNFALDYINDLLLKLSVKNPKHSLNCSCAIWQKS